MTTTDLTFEFIEAIYIDPAGRRVPVTPYVNIPIGKGDFSLLVRNAEGELVDPADRGDELLVYSGYVYDRGLAGEQRPAWNVDERTDRERAKAFAHLFQLRRGEEATREALLTAWSAAEAEDILKTASEADL